MLQQGYIGVDFARRCTGVHREVLSPKKRNVRLILIAGLSLLWACGVAARLVTLQVTNRDRWQKWASKQHTAEVKLASERGPLYDRRNRLLAVSVPAGSVYARPRMISNKQEVADRLAKALQLKREFVAGKLSQAKPFVWIQRQVPRAFADRVAELDIPGVGYFLEPRRYYPYKGAASALIGRVGLDGVGLSGVELLYERHLHGEHIERVERKDALGNLIQRVDQVGETLEPPKGKALELTLDAELQLVMDEELEAGRRSANAKAAMGVMIDAQTGEILALGQSPSLNFNTDTVSSKEALRNLLVETVYEPGSIMKPIVAAAALDAKVFNAHEVIFCENGRYPFGRHTIKDVHPFGALSVFDVVVRSSNIGMTKIGMRMGKDRVYEALTRFGFGESSELGLPGETPGILRPVDRWAAVDVATHSFGQGVAVTPLQIVRAISAIANGGTLPNLSLIKDSRDRKVPRRVLSEATAGQVREMMYGVVEDEHGTGRKSEVEGVRVGGKTGTAQKARAGGRGYQPGAYAASFVGFVDASPLEVDQVLTMLVIIDEPKGGTIYGGAVAAPVFQRIMQRSLHMLAAERRLNPRQEPAPRRHPAETQVAYVRGTGPRG